MVRLIASRTTSCDAGGEAAMRATWPVPMPRPVRRDRPSGPAGAGPRGGGRARQPGTARRAATGAGARGGLAAAVASGLLLAEPRARWTPEGCRATLGRAPMRTMQTRPDLVAVAAAAGAASILG